MKTLLAIIGFLAFVLIAGSVGALEQDIIGFGQCFIQSAIGLAILGGIAYLTTWRE